MREIAIYFHLFVYYYNISTFYPIIVVKICFHIWMIFAINIIGLGGFFKVGCRKCEEKEGKMSIAIYHAV